MLAEGQIELARRARRLDDPGVALVDQHATRQLALDPQAGDAASALHRPPLLDEGAEARAEAIAVQGHVPEGLEAGVDGLGGAEAIALAELGSGQGQLGEHAQIEGVGVLGQQRPELAQRVDGHAQIGDALLGIRVDRDHRRLERRHRRPVFGARLGRAVVDIQRVAVHNQRCEHR